MPDHTILATVTVACDDDAASIELQETLLKNHAPFHQARHVSSETDRGGRYIQAGCQAGTYSQPTVAHITSEDGYTPQAMVLQITGTDITVSDSACHQPPPWRPGRRWRRTRRPCAVSTPSVSARPAAIHPQPVTCQ
jgi:hypothetical protein